MLFESAKGPNTSGGGASRPTDEKWKNNSGTHDGVKHEDQRESVNGGSRAARGAGGEEDEDKDEDEDETNGNRERARKKGREEPGGVGCVQ